MSPGTEKRVRRSPRFKASAGMGGKAEVLVLGSSDVECNDEPEKAGPSSSSSRRLRPLKELTYEKEEESDELDEWGMPPSAQLR